MAWLQCTEKDIHPHILNKIINEGQMAKVILKWADDSSEYHSSKRSDKYLYSILSINPYHPYRTTAKFFTNYGRQGELELLRSLRDIEKTYRELSPKLQIAIAEDNILYYGLSSENQVLLNIFQKKKELVQRTARVSINNIVLRDKLNSLFENSLMPMVIRNSINLHKMAAAFSRKVIRLSELDDRVLQDLSSAILNRYINVYDEIDPLNKALARKTWMAAMISQADLRKSYMYRDACFFYYLLTKKSDVMVDGSSTIYDVVAFCIDGQDYTRGETKSCRRLNLAIFSALLAKLHDDSVFNFEIANNDVNYSLFFEIMNLKFDDEYYLFK